MRHSIKNIKSGNHNMKNITRLSKSEGWLYQKMVKRRSHKKTFSDSSYMNNAGLALIAAINYRDFITPTPNKNIMQGLIVLLVLALVITVFILGPLLLIWSLNVLFSLVIPYTFANWLAGFILIVLFGKPSIKYNKN